MKTIETTRPAALFPLFLSWLGLVLLTLLSLWLAQRSGSAAWLQLPVAAIVWLKGWIVARYFIESHLAHPFIAVVVRVFILCVPVALILAAWLGDRFARLTTLSLQ
ncbi:hypothetical protein [Aromatoleum anaerobium]|uniref:Uncharacterized protein n=1 Tax=Aromatoleum anaerobium TaxID=182180 RepID=A0ABX1PIX4_9RHOO|nr:hypothetical protein [Aromatoleum anaerobium]MCK0509032.1 hypothetical protein [Aromatoleum anaerobium]